MVPVIVLFIIHLGNKIIIIIERLRPVPKRVGTVPRIFAKSQIIENFIISGWEGVP